MHCVECGAEMILVNVIQVQGDATAVAPSVEDHRFLCSECHEVKQRLVLIRHGREIDAAPDMPASAAQEKHIAALLRCVLAKIRDQ
jgi:hypothetical protein